MEASSEQGEELVQEPAPICATAAVSQAQTPVINVAPGNTKITEAIWDTLCFKIGVQNASSRLTHEEFHSCEVQCLRCKGVHGEGVLPGHLLVESLLVSGRGVIACEASDWGGVRRRLPPENPACAGFQNIATRLIPYIGSRSTPQQATAAKRG